ncbi:MAG: double-strand break repair helicase AddA, partial [Salinarimonadaceae bacterium]
LELLRSPAGAWVLYKLDRGVDHVLVDEAQDTNPEQWEILREVTGDFFAGEGQAAGRVRTVFAVGDEKQSIYSFQGAEPRKFSESRRHWERLAGQVAAAFETISLTVSFRSAPGVLAAVDQVFSDPDLFRGLSFDDGATGTAHQSAWPDIPSAVELWPFEAEAGEAEADAWTHPVDEPEARAPAVRLARKIAQAVKAWTTTGDALGRVWRPGDVLILVRGRNAAFFATIRALKDVGLPVAGADRLDITQHIAVQDLVAAGRAALLPDDDLTLAAALKSPLVGFDDDDLLRIAVGRAEDVSLVEAMRAAAQAGDAAAIRGCEALDSWRELAAARGPFRFYAEILGPLGGRRRLVARLGAEAGDAIDAFLAEALSSEHPATPSLAHFLAGFAASDREIKRDLEAGGDAVRVMTVHGAKGLEAPVVVLIDQAYATGDRSPGLFDVGAPLPLWSPSSKTDCAPAAQAREARRARDVEERNRLLYVALTRAADHLVIAPFSKKGADGFHPASWGARVEAALAGGGYGLTSASLPYGDVLLWRDPEPAPKARETTEALVPQDWPIPQWLDRPADPEPEPAPPIRPSSALTAADQPRRPRERPLDPAARLRGVLVHALLERLASIAPDRRRAAAAAFVAARAAGLSMEARERIVADALAVIEDARLAALFAPGAFAEAPIAGEVEIGDAGVRTPVAGQIDRLAVTQDAVIFADFKTGARPPADGAPRPGQLSQMALYHALLAAIYPGRPIRAFLVWTAGPLVAEIPEADLEAALRGITPA